MSTNFKTKVQTKTKRVVKNAVTTAQMKKSAERTGYDDFYLIEGETAYVTRSSGLYDTYQNTVSYDNSWN